MKSTFWNRCQGLLPLAGLAWACNAGSMSAAEPAQHILPVSAVLSSSDERLFDSLLLNQVPESYAPAAPICPDSAMPSPQALSDPGSVFEPAPSAGFLQAGQGALTAQNSVAAALMPGGYLDPAAPVTMFRLRYDVANGNDFPDRGEYFYAKCGCFRQLNIDPNANGPGGINTSVDYQDVRPYFEYAFNARFSVFTELAVRFVDYNSLPGLPALGSAGGFSDMNVGFKYAFIAQEDEYLTFQWRTYLPTGDSLRGLGTHHVSIEPSLLYYRRLSDRWLLQGQLTSFTPIGVSAFASNVLQYGGGVGYILLQGELATVIPTLEMVGWTFLGGQKFSPTNGGLQSASGDTIVNVKPGVRIGLGNAPGPMMMQRQSIYAGFGIPITSDQFYNDLFRVEYRFVF